MQFAFFLYCAHLSKPKKLLACFNTSLETPTKPCMSDWIRVFFLNECTVALLDEDQILSGALFE